MTLDLVTIPCLSDNYAFLLHNAETAETALVDAPEAAPIAAELGRRGWRLTDILLTHHHDDHFAGVPELRAAHNPRVIGAAADAHRLPPLDLAVAEGDSVTVCGEAAVVLEVSGHTVGHIAYHFPQTGAAFTGDSLMACGCGRLFEGTPAQMWASLQKLAALPEDTLICSGHEYTASNIRFALTVDPENPDLISRARDTDAARDAGRPTVPSTLALELRTNPFLRADRPELSQMTGLTDPVQAFAEIRARKDRF